MRPNRRDKAKIFPKIITPDPGSLTVEMIVVLQTCDSASFLLQQKRAVNHPKSGNPFMTPLKKGDRFNHRTWYNIYHKAKQSTRRVLCFDRTQITYNAIS